MSDRVRINKSKLDALASAFRAKMGTEDLLTLQEMISEVPALVSMKAGTYDASGNMLKSWDQLVSDGDVIVENGLMNTHFSDKTRFNNVKSIVISSDGVTGINNNAFTQLSELTSVTIPDSVTSIGSSAFWGCSGLTSITIPDGVTSIGNSAFRECTGLTSVTIPDSVTGMGVYVFKGCTNLTTIYYSGTATGAPWGAENATVVP